MIVFFPFALSPVMGDRADTIPILCRKFAVLLRFSYDLTTSITYSVTFGMAFYDWRSASACFFISIVF